MPFTQKVSDNADIMRKRQSGVVGIVAVLLILAFQAVERWSVLDSVLSKLHGTTFGNILLSPVLPLVLALAAIYLIVEGNKEKKQEKPNGNSVEIKESFNPSFKQEANPSIHVHMAGEPKTGRSTVTAENKRAKPSLEGCLRHKVVFMRGYMVQATSSRCV